MPESNLEPDVKACMELFEELKKSGAFDEIAPFVRAPLHPFTWITLAGKDLIYVRK